MRKTVFLFTTILTLLLNGSVFAQKNKTDNDYNLKKAYEVLQEEKDEAKALDLVSKQLRETPDNLQALILCIRPCFSGRRSSVQPPGMSTAPWRRTGRRRRTS